MSPPRFIMYGKLRKTYIFLSPYYREVVPISEISCEPMIHWQSCTTKPTLAYRRGAWPMKTSLFLSAELPGLDMYWECLLSHKQLFNLVQAVKVDDKGNSFHTHQTSSCRRLVNSLPLYGCIALRGRVLTSAKELVTVHVSICMVLVLHPEKNNCVVSYSQDIVREDTKDEDEMETKITKGDRKHGRGRWHGWRK